MSLIEFPTATSELVREIIGDGPEDARILVITDRPSYNDKAAGRPLSDFTGKLLFSQFLKAGISRSRVRVESLCERIPPDRKFFLLDAFEQNRWRDDCLRRISEFRPNVVVPLGEEPLRLVTGKHSINKWHLSILDGINGWKVIPLHHPDYIMKFFKEIPFLTFGAMRVAEESQFPEIRKVERNFLINPTCEEAIAWIDAHQGTEFLCTDIETGQGQITCIGFSTDPREAICIPTLPRDYSPTDFHKLWCAIGSILGNDSKKVAQNGIYDASYLSKYGIRIRNFHHDTMIAQKFLHPELPMGLDTVARLYTKEPYWKDEGKDWGLRQDINQLYYYNCKDTAVTLEAAHAQKIDLKQRSLEKLFYEKQMAYCPAAWQMSWTGLPIDQAERTRLREETEKEITQLKAVLDSEAERVLGKVINPKSHKDVKDLLRMSGYRIPVKHDKETSNKEALMKLRLKDPESKILTPLIKIGEANKKLSNYINYRHDPDNRLRFTLYNGATESMRWSSGLDPWGNGLNGQTIPADTKSQFIAPPGEVLIEMDLRQAESRFVAWDGPVPVLQQMYRDGIDIHRFVASRPQMFNKPMDQITKDERQLGKKTGHAANYGMMAPTLADQCLKEMDLVLSVSKAESMLNGYHSVMDGGIRRWQRKIEEEVTRTKRLRTPLGYERYFYDRIGPDLFREAYAYRPQNTVVGVLNELLLFLFGKPHVTLLNQIHDALLLSVPETHSKEIIDLIKDEDRWNPRMQLAGGELRIPIEIKIGKIWNKMEVVYEGH